DDIFEETNIVDDNQAHRAELDQLNENNTVEEIEKNDIENKNQESGNSRDVVLPSLYKDENQVDQFDEKDASVLSLKELNLESEIKASLIIDKPETKNDNIVRAKAYLNEDVVSAEVSFNNNKIQLNQNVNNDNLWTGSMIISNNEREDILSPIILANIKTVDRSGNIDLFDIDWKNIKPLKTSIIDQYLFLKSYSSKYIQPLLSLSTIYYQILLIITCLAFFLNIFIKIKKQNFQVIFSSAGFIVLLTILLVI
ncbi:hypothetical protein K8R66_01080, partial [bacterium]|nr:hypothetical protein [bacterium]